MTHVLYELSQAANCCCLLMSRSDAKLCFSIVFRSRCNWGFRLLHKGPSLFIFRWLVCLLTQNYSSS